MLRLRRFLYELLDGEQTHTGLGHLVIAISVAVVIASVAVTLIATDPRAAAWQGFFRTFEWACLVVFTLEYALRIWIAPESHRHYRDQPALMLGRYILSNRGIIDLLAIAPFWLGPLLGIDAELIWLMQTLRILKLTRYTSALDTLAAVIRSEARQLLAAGVIMLSLLVLLSTLMFVIERHAQPDKFGSALDGLWWGVVTLATVGYGDVVPVTGPGRFLGGIAVILGLAMFALPAGILASGFAEEIRKRNFVVSWNLVAKVPLFADLPAMRIADIAAMLKARSAERGELIVRKGDKADCMYLIASGSADVLLSRPVRLVGGDFFGEMALLDDIRRTADVVATGFCQ
ncbi:MAG: cyclic nucleotide-gated ion channel, partial [Acidobacteriota bacterium]